MCEKLISSFFNIFKTKIPKVKPRKFLWRSSETNITSVKKKNIFCYQKRKEKLNMKTQISFLLFLTQKFSK